MTPDLADALHRWRVPLLTDCREHRTLTDAEVETLAAHLGTLFEGVVVLDATADSNPAS